MHNEIAIAMRRKKITQEVASRTMSISRVTLNRYLNGHTQLGVNDFMNLITLIGWEIKRGEEIKKINEC